MCPKPKIKDPQLYQTAQAPVYNENTEEEEAARRGRRGTILAGTAPTPVASGGGKTLLGQ